MPERGNKPSWEVLFEDNHLLVVNKPALLPTMGVTEGTASMVTEAKRYLKHKYHKPGNVYVGVVSRLDAHVSGVLVLARTSKAAARLADQFREASADKTYWAAVESPPAAPEATLTDWVLKDERLRRMKVVSARQAGAQKARLHYRVLQTTPKGTLVEVQLETGRKHQIRLQLAELGCPILGDRKYGSQRPFAVGIALHARRLAVEHPTTRKLLEFFAPLPPTWRQLGFRPPGDEGS